MDVSTPDGPAATLDLDRLSAPDAAEAADLPGCGALPGLGEELAAPAPGPAEDGWPAAGVGLGPRNWVEVTSKALPDTEIDAAIDPVAVSPTSTAATAADGIIKIAKRRHRTFPVVAAGAG